MGYGCIKKDWSQQRNHPSMGEVSVVVNETAVMEVVVVADSGTSTPPCLPNSELKGHQPVVAVVVEESDSKVASTITDQVPTVMVEDLLMVQVGTVHHPEEDSAEEDLVGMAVVPPEEVMEEEAEVMEEAEAEEDAAPEDEKVEKRKKSQQGAGLMQVEERNTGAVSKEVYSEYLRAGKGYIVVPLLVMSVALLQVSQVMSSYW